MASNRVFVSPGVYTSEKDLTFVTRSVGVTTLGLAGETTKGPAFQPIFITNYDEFMAFFGSLNSSKFIETGYPQYELPYIAKSYLSQSNQLYVTRVLGLSGYDAGSAWGITLNGALDQDTIGTGATYSNLSIALNYNALGTSVTGITTTPNVQELQDLFSSASTYTEIQTEMNNLLNTAYLEAPYTGATVWYKADESASEFTGIYLYDMIKLSGEVLTVSGTVTGSAIVYSGTSYVDAQDVLVGILRSRAKYDGNETLTFETTAVTISNSGTTSLINPLGEFVLSGVSSIQGAYSYTVSMDNLNQNYIINALGSKAHDKTTSLFTEEIYDALFDKLNADGKIRGINMSLINYTTSQFSHYKFGYSYAQTPYVLSQVIGNQVFKLFRFITISDGNHANQEIKFSIANIKPDEKEFDVLVRNFYDTDAKPSIIERFSKCTMDPTQNNYVGRKIGTYDGEYPSKSDYILIDINTDIDTSQYFPAGFMGIPVREYQSGTPTNVVAPKLLYKTTYTQIEQKKKAFLGISDIEGIDQPMFNYKGALTANGSDLTASTSCFHMDSGATSVLINGISGYTIEVGTEQFRTEAQISYDAANAPIGTTVPYEKIYSRKFTFAPYGGYDGWDIYRTQRTIQDKYVIGQPTSDLGVSRTNFKNIILSNGQNGTNSDYYAFLEAIYTFSNPEATNINVFATPGIDTINNNTLVEATIDMVESDRADSLYIVTTPDYANGTDMTAEEVVDSLTDMYDSNYTCTYWPWIQVEDSENNVYIWLPPTRDVVRNIAYTDNIAFPWFSVAGIERGDVSCIKARKKLTLSERDTLYEGRINPIATFSTDGVKIWGNKTLQVKDTALNRINVRRLLLQARKLISAVSLRLLFDQNDAAVRTKFLSLVNPILESIRSARGLVDFRVTVDSDPESIDRNELNGKIYIKPTRALEYINIEFVVTPTGASFDNI